MHDRKPCSTVKYTTAKLTKLAKGLCEVTHWLPTFTENKTNFYFKVLILNTWSVYVKTWVDLKKKKKRTRKIKLLFPSTSSSNVPFTSSRRNGKSITWLLHICYHRNDDKAKKKGKKSDSLLSTFKGQIIRKLCTQFS